MNSVDILARKQVNAKYYQKNKKSIIENNLYKYYENKDQILTRKKNRYHERKEIIQPDQEVPIVVVYT